MLSVFAMLLSIGCKTAKTTTETVYRDSIIERKVVIPKDTTIYIAGDSVNIHDTLPCPEANYSKESTSESGRTKATVTIKNGKLEIACHQDSLNKVIKLLYEQLTKEKYSLKTVTETKYVPVDKLVEYTPQWHWYLHGILLLLLIWLFRNPLISLIKHLLSKWK
jgi:ribosome-associated translation inhibitor RaiA